MSELPDELFDDLQARVSSGAKFLDENNPGWREKVDPSALEMHSCKGCVLGQLFDELAQDSFCNNGFEYGAIKFLTQNGRPDIGATRDLGFDIPDSYAWDVDYVKWGGVAWETLTDLWIKEIQR